jgi:hypothetical protein
MQYKGEPTILTPTDGRSGRIVKGGAILRVLLISLALAVCAMLAVYMFVV